MSSDTAQILLLGWLGFCAAAVSPGPNMVAVVSRTLGSGLRSGLRVAFGISIGAFLWAWVSVFASVSSLLAFLIYGSYGLLFSAGMVQRFYRKFSRWADALFGGIFSILGGILLGQLRL